MSERKENVIYSVATAAARLMLLFVALPMAIWQAVEVGAPAAIEIFAIFGGCAVAIWLVGCVVANYFSD